MRRSPVAAAVTAADAGTPQPPRESMATACEALCISIWPARASDPGRAALHAHPAADGHGGVHGPFSSKAGRQLLARLRCQAAKPAWSRRGHRGPLADAAPAASSASPSSPQHVHVQQRRVQVQRWPAPLLASTGQRQQTMVTAPANQQRRCSSEAGCAGRAGDLHATRQPHNRQDSRWVQLAEARVSMSGLDDGAGSSRPGQQQPAERLS